MKIYANQYVREEYKETDEFVIDTCRQYIGTEIWLRIGGLGYGSNYIRVTAVSSAYIAGNVLSAQVTEAFELQLPVKDHLYNRCMQCMKDVQSIPIDIIKIRLPIQIITTDELMEYINEDIR